MPGIGPVRAGRIAATWVEQRHIREVMAALQGYGISTSLAVRIYKRFGDDSARVIAQEPYRLAREVWGIGFKTADTIAQAIGIAGDAPERLQAGVLHALGQAATRGTPCCPRKTWSSRRGCSVRRGGADCRGDHRPHRYRRAHPGNHPGSQTATERRMLALAPFARAESGLASRLQDCTPRPDAPGSVRSLRPPTGT